MDSGSGTTFLSLPISLQLDLLKQLSWKDSLQARLVCDDFYQLLNYLEPPKFFLTDKPNHPDRTWEKENGAGVVLPVLVSTTCEKLGRLKVEDLKTSLPIISSTRMQIPCPDELIIDDGNSKANVLKLLRYYTKTLRTLCLASYCLEEIRPWELKRTISLNQMTRLEISFGLMASYGKLLEWVKHKERLQFEGRIKQHLSTLASFLRAVHLPSLRSFYLRLSSRCGAPSVTSHLVSLGKFRAGLETFLARHGSGLIEISASLPCLEVMNSFNHASKSVKKLSLSYEMDHNGRYDDVYQFRTDPRLAFGNFTNLVDLYICPGSFGSGGFLYNTEEENMHHAVTAQLLVNNRQTLRNFVYSSRSSGCIPRRFQNFGWLISGSQLQTLQLLFVHYNPGAFTLGHKLEHLTEFVIVLIVDSQDNYWSQSFFRWVGNSMPALRNLKINLWISHNPAPAGIALRTLIERSTSLRQIRLDGWYINKPVSDEVEEWIAGSGGMVEAKWVDERDSRTREKYEITIHRA